MTLEGKVVSLSTPASPAIAQSGIIADESGGIRFVVWAKSNAPKMEEGRWYRLESAVVDEYKGVPNLKVHSGTTIKEIEKSDPLIPAPIPVKDLHPGVASVRAKVIQEWDVTHDRMLQSGLLGDETGTVKFIIWKEQDKEKLAVGSVYSVFTRRQKSSTNGSRSTSQERRSCRRKGILPRQPAATWRSAAPSCISRPPGIIKRCPVQLQPGTLPTELLPDPRDPAQFRLRSADQGLA